MKIGELSRLSGVSIRMLRYYEAEGLLQPTRTGSGYRLYDPAAEQAVKRIRLLVEGGLTLKTIRQLLPCIRSDHTFEPCSELRATLNRQIAVLNSRIVALDKSRRILAGFLDSAR